MGNHRLAAPAGLLLAMAFLLCPAPIPAAPPSPDEAISRGWRLLDEGKPSEARRALEGTSPSGYDLGDYLVYFRGLSMAGEGDLAGAAAAEAALKAGWPDSPLVPCLAHELA